VEFRDSVMTFHHHDGQSRNFDAWLDVDLDGATTIVLLSNSRQQKLGELSAAIAAILKGQSYRQPKRSLALFLDRQVDSLPIAGFVALYQDLLRTKGDVFELQDEYDLNSFGYHLMNGNRLDDAIQLFKLNVERFPASPNGYDSLAEALMAKGDTVAAAASYERLLTLDPTNASARALLTKIRGSQRPR
jgi:tetratricopeptide (TPR) repeat protein